MCGETYILEAPSSLPVAVLLLLLLLVRPRVERRGIADGGGGDACDCWDGRWATVATLIARLLLAVMVEDGVQARETPRRRTKLLPARLIMLCLHSC